MTNTISANTLFHFTPTKENLLSILTRKFYVRYSLEIFNAILDAESTELVIPMTCFCDIPLSQIKNHTKAYGSYAIGLSKSWGIRNQVSPVHYVYPNSTTSEILKSLSHRLERFFDVADNPDDHGERTNRYLNQLPEEVQNLLESQKNIENTNALEKILELQNQLAHFLRFLKPYEGKIYRNEKYSTDIQNFYEEREWRYVPPKELLQKVSVKDSYNADFFKDPIKRRLINIKLASHLKLEFLPNDIRFIIVKHEDEIPKFLDEIHKIYRDKSTYDELTLLGTRLISLEQILQNI
ncbi:MAG: abortive infection system antitoxin AbiGi family protein [Bacteroidia bacterium]